MLIRGTPYECNPTWHEVNKQLNANVQMSIFTGADNPTKFATLMASNDLPDSMHIFLGITWNDFWRRRGLALVNPPQHFKPLDPFRATAGDKPVSFRASARGLCALAMPVTASIRAVPAGPAQLRQHQL